MMHFIGFTVCAVNLKSYSLCIQALLFHSFLVNKCHIYIVVFPKAKLKSTHMSLMHKKVDILGM